MWCLCRASPLQISLIGVCPLLRPPPSRGLPTVLQGLPGIGGSTLIRCTVERHARAQLALGLWAPAQWAQAPPTSVPCTPQMAPPLCQPPPSQTATLYQQGSHFRLLRRQSCPAGGQSTKDHGRQKTRGQGDGGCSASHHRGVQEKTSRQMPHLEGDPPSGATPNIPQTTASEGILPQQGGRV